MYVAGLKIDPWSNVFFCLQIQLGTVDIFQGREAKIVIVSLVRNSGEFDAGSASIGFLKVRVVPKCVSNDRAYLDSVGEPYQRGSVASKTRSLRHGQCFEPAEESHLAHNPR